MEKILQFWKLLIIMMKVFEREKNCSEKRKRSLTDAPSPWSSWPPPWEACSAFPCSTWPFSSALWSGIAACCGKKAESHRKIPRFEFIGVKGRNKIYRSLEATPQDEGLNAEHPGHAKERQQHQKRLETLLRVVEKVHFTRGAVLVVLRVVRVLEEEHVDEANQQTRRAAGHGRGEVDPFVEDEHHQVPEHAHEEEHLRDEFTKDVDELAEKPGGKKQPMV